MAETLGSAVLKLGTDDTGLQKGLSKAEQDSGARMKAIGKNMSVRVTAPILAVGAAVFKATEGIDEAMATIATGTGATGKALQGLKTDFEAVYGSVPGDAQEVATAIADLNTTLGLTGEPLQETAKAALEMADAMKIDVGTAIDQTARAMKAFGEESRDPIDVMDRMFVVSQATNIPLDELSKTVTKYGQNLAAAGYTLDESIALIGKFHEEGVTARTALSGLSTALDKIANEASPDFTEAIAESEEGIESNTEALEENLAAQQSLEENLRDVATDALEGHQQSVADNAEAITKAEQDLKIFNARMSEQGDEVKESTRLANKFKKAELQKTLSGLRTEQDDLTESGKHLKDSIEDTTDVQVDLKASAEEIGDEYDDVIGTLADGKDELNELQGAEVQLTDKIAIHSDALETFKQKQEAAAGTSLDMHDEIDKLFNRIATATTEQEAISLAADYFGATAGPAMANAIRSGALETDDLIVAMNNGEGAIMANAEATRTNTERLAMMRAEISERLAGAWGSLPLPIQATVGALGGVLAAAGPMLIAMPGLIRLTKGMATAVKALTLANIRSAAALVAQKVAMVAMRIAMIAMRAATIIATAIQWAWNMALLANPIVLIIAAIVAAIAGLVYGIIRLVQFVRKHWDTIIGYTKKLWQKIGEAFAKIKQLVLQAWNAIKAGATQVWNKIKSTFDSVLGKVKAIFTKVVEFIKRNWKLILGILFPALGLAMLIARNWGRIVGAVKSVWNKVVKGVTTFFSDILAKFAEIGKGVVDAVAGWGTALFEKGSAIGQTIVDGIISGIRAVLGTFGRVGRWAANKIFGDLETAIEASSPSRRAAREIGKPLAEGIIRGVVLGLRQLPREVEKPIQRAIDGAVKRVERSRSRFEKAWGRMVSATSQVLSRTLRHELTPGEVALQSFRDSIEGGPGQTPAERALERLQSRASPSFEARGRTPAEQELYDMQRARMLADEEEKIEVARAHRDQLVEEGEHGQALKDAEEQLSEALLSRKVRELQERAERERDARDAELERKRVAYEQDLEAQTLALEAQVETELAAYDAQVETELAQLEAQAERERTHRDAEIALQEQQFADDLERLKLSIANGELTQEEGQDAIIALLESYGVDYATAADELGTTFADHMGDTILKSAAAGGQIKSALDGAVRAVKKAARQMKRELWLVRQEARKTAAAARGAASAARAATAAAASAGAAAARVVAATAPSTARAGAGAHATSSPSFGFGAAGAIVRRPTFALIGEVPEALIPLHKMAGASALPANIGGGGGGLTQVFEGDVYGVEDFDDRVARGIVDAERRGVRVTPER